MDINAGTAISPVFRHRLVQKILTITKLQVTGRIDYRYSRVYVIDILSYSYTEPGVDHLRTPHRGGGQGSALKGPIYTVAQK